MQYLGQNLMMVAIPSLLGVAAIVIPFRSYRRTKKDRFLTVGILNAVFCGLAVLTLLASAVFNWLPGAILFLFIAVGFVAMLVLEATKRSGK